MDTNINEAFNNAATWFAPRNKVFAGSVSLSVRLSLAVGVSSVGLKVFFNRLLSKLGIGIAPSMLHYVKVKESKRSKRLTKINTHFARETRTKNKFKDLKRDTKLAWKDRNKKDGAYETGLHMRDPDEDSDDATPPPKKKTKRPAPKYKCSQPFCRLKGHSTTKIFKCKKPIGIVPFF
jgi:hypothetical protein